MVTIPRDLQRVTTIAAVSSADGVTIVPLYADPTTHRLLVNMSGSALSTDALTSLTTTINVSNAAAPSVGQVLTATSSTQATWQSPTTGGTVTSVSVVSANGFSGTVATATTTPAITLQTSISGLLAGSANALIAAASSDIDIAFGSQTANTFYASPNGSAGNPTFRAMVAADVPTLNQNTTGQSGTVATISGLISAGTNVTITGSGTSASPYVIAASGSTMVYPASGIAVSTGSAWGTSLTAPSGAIVGTTDTQTLSNKTFTSPTISSIVNTGTLTLPTSTDTLVGRATTDTLTSKWFVPRIYSAASQSTLTPEKNTYDVFRLTAQAAALTIANPSTTTPNDGDQMRIAILDNGTAQTISFGTAYVAKGGIALPTTTTASKNMEMGFEYNSNLSAWNLLALAQST